MGKVPAGLFPVANCNLKARVTVSYGDRLLTEAIQLLHDNQPARDTMLFLLRESRKQGLLGRADIKGTEDPANYAKVSTDVNGESRELVVESVRGTWKSYYQNIADVLNSGAELAVKPAEVRRTMAVYDAAMRSSEIGETVRL